MFLSDQCGHAWKLPKTSLTYASANIGSDTNRPYPTTVILALAALPRLCSYPVRFPTQRVACQQTSREHSAFCHLLFLIVGITQNACELTADSKGHGEKQTATRRNRLLSSGYKVLLCQAQYTERRVTFWNDSFDFFLASGRGRESKQNVASLLTLQCEAELYNSPSKSHHREPLKAPDLCLNISQDMEFTPNAFHSSFCWANNAVTLFGEFMTLFG